MEPKIYSKMKLSSWKKGEYIMTINQMTKLDIQNMYQKIDINQLDVGALFALKTIVESELAMSIRETFNEPHLTPRNLICFDNCIARIKHNKLVEAWWELVDILSDKADIEYVTTNELVLIKFALNALIEALSN